jgi:hypothetical protein
MKNMTSILKTAREHVRDFSTRSKDFVSALRLYVQLEDTENNSQKHTRCSTRKDLYATLLKYSTQLRKASHTYG